MSLRDRLRFGQHAGGGDGGDGDVVPAGGGRDDVTDFDPRSDGDYRCAEAGLYLRFARPAVMETSASPDDGRADPARGEFTAAGRFTVQRRFGRPVVYTVLEIGEDARTLTARRTDTTDRGSAELMFAFEQDDPGSG